MDRERFVDLIRLYVQESAIADTISILSWPPGRRPRQELLVLSTWFNGLAFDDRQNVERVIEETAHAAVFGFLCVLDGCRVIENPPERGTLDLRYHRGEVDISLNDETGSPLHELL